MSCRYCIIESQKAFSFLAFFLIFVKSGFAFADSYVCELGLGTMDRYHLSHMCRDTIGLPLVDRDSCQNLVYKDVC